MTGSLDADVNDGRVQSVNPSESTFGMSVFLSYPKPYNSVQTAFMQRLLDCLRERGFSPRTLGVTDYDLDAPLKAVRRLMFESHGLLAVAFRRMHVKAGVGNFRSDLHNIKEQQIDDLWLTTPWAHIEPAMAYQLGLPILTMRENGVRADGILEKGVTGLYAGEFDLGSEDDYLNTPEFRQVLAKWEHQVRTVIDRKGSPPRLYD